MSTAELKTDIIHRIAGITDKSKLEEISQFISFQSDNDIFITSGEDKKLFSKQEIKLLMANSSHTKTFKMKFRNG